MKDYNSSRRSNLDQPSSFAKQNIASSSRHSTPDQADTMYKEFQTLKQINRILDSNPESEQAKEQKIRSLVIMFKKQLDINKKLQNQLSDNSHKIQGIENELTIKNTQIKSYEQTIIEQKQKISSLEGENKKLFRQIKEKQQEIKLREDLIDKMRESYTNQTYSMENQLHFLKQKTLDHFKQKLNFPLQPETQIPAKQKIKRPRSHSRANSERKGSSKQNLKKNICSKKQDIIRKNILALSKQQNKLKQGGNLLKKFQENKLLIERMTEIKKGNYHSVQRAIN